VHSIDGLPTSHPLPRGSGDCFKVCGSDALIAWLELILRTDASLGWLTVFAWVVNCAGPPAIISNIITALAVFNYDTYELKTWHIMLIMWGLILVPFVFNLWFRQLLNAFELLGGLLHIIFFITSIITLIVLARRSTADFVFNTLTTGQSGWNNPGVCWGLGLLTVTFSVSGA
jgi:choline transport protein